MVLIKQIFSLSDICYPYSPINRILEDELVVFVASTTGQGDEPTNMNRFWKFLLRKNLPPDSLESLNFAVLGLGDSSYQKFNFVAKRLHKRLTQLGATSVVSLGKKLLDNSAFLCNFRVH